MRVVIVSAYKQDQILAVLADLLWIYRCQNIVIDDGSGKEYRHIFDSTKDICV